MEESADLDWHDFWHDVDDCWDPYGEATPQDFELWRVWQDTCTSRRPIGQRDRRAAAIAVPTELSPRQRQLIEELAQVNGELSGGEAPRKRLLDRVLSLLEK